MKRIFVRASIAIVGMITWLLPRQAESHHGLDGTVKDWVSCSAYGWYWICDSDEQCQWVLVKDNSILGYTLYYGCS